MVGLSDSDVLERYRTQRPQGWAELLRMHLTREIFARRDVVILCEADDLVHALPIAEVNIPDARKQAREVDEFIVFVIQERVGDQGQWLGSVKLFDHHPVFPCTMDMYSRLRAEQWDDMLADIVLGVLPPGKLIVCDFNESRVYAHDFPDDLIPNPEIQDDQRVVVIQKWPGDAVELAHVCGIRVRQQPLPVLENA